jgi:hypothetical protein
VERTWGIHQTLLAARFAELRDALIPFVRASLHVCPGQFLEARQAAQCAFNLNPEFSEAAALRQ